MQIMLWSVSYHTKRKHRNLRLLVSYECGRCYPGDVLFICEIFVEEVNN